MRFSQSKSEEISLGISIAPLIDIVFLLLIFFMLTSHFDVLSGIDIALPEISKKGADLPADTIIVALDKSGTCFLQRKKVKLKDLYTKLRDYAQGKKVRLMLQADRDVKHGNVVRIMDIAEKAGIQSIIISAQWEPEEIL